MTMTGIQALATMSDATTTEWFVLGGLLYLAFAGTYFTVIGAEQQWTVPVFSPRRNGRLSPWYRVRFSKLGVVMVWESYTELHVRRHQWRDSLRIPVDSPGACQRPH